MKTTLTFVGLALAALPCGMPAEGHARNLLEIQNYPSGEHVYRVEVRNLRWLEVLEAGDRDGEGELHDLVVQLSTYNPDAKTQYDGLKFSGEQPYLANRGGS